MVSRLKGQEAVSPEKSEVVSDKINEFFLFLNNRYAFMP